MVSVGDKFESHGITKKPEDLKVSLETLRFFSDYYNENRIFFTETQALNLDSLRDLCIKIYSQFRTAEVQEQLKDWALAAERYVESQERFQSEFPPLRKKIEIDFRELIGIV